mgnify:FL=1
MLRVLGLFQFRFQSEIRWFALLLLLILPGMASAEALPIFDVHSHYKTEDAAVISPEDVIRLMDENNISHMVIVGEPPERALKLSEQSSGRIIPLLGLYQSHEDKTSWMHDAGLPERIRLGLQQGDYKGIGEIHIFEADKQSSVFREILQLANQHELPVLLHGDRFVVKQAFKWFPGLIIVWAHLGEAPDTDLLEEMLIAYPNLYIDTSVRDVLMVKDG